MRELQTMRKNIRRLFWAKPIRNALKHRITGGLDTLSRNIATIDPHVMSPMSCPPRSLAVNPHRAGTPPLTRLVGHVVTHGKLQSKECQK